MRPVPKHNLRNAIRLARPNSLKGELTIWRNSESKKIFLFNQDKVSAFVNL